MKSLATLATAALLATSGVAVAHDVAVHDAAGHYRAGFEDSGFDRPTPAFGRRSGNDRFARPSRFDRSRQIDGRQVCHTHGQERTELQEELPMDCPTELTHCHSLDARTGRQGGFRSVPSRGRITVVPAREPLWHAAQRERELEEKSRRENAGAD